MAAGHGLRGGNWAITGPRRRSGTLGLFTHGCVRFSRRLCQDCMARWKSSSNGLKLFPGWRHVRARALGTRELLPPAGWESRIPARRAAHGMASSLVTQRARGRRPWLVDRRA